MPVDVRHLVEFASYWGIAAIIFAESGIMLGFFLPGDSLLFTAGILAAEGTLNLAVLLPLLAVAAIAGDQVGYAFGRRVGVKLFHKPDARLFKRKHVDRTQAFYDRHGAKTIILARFVPVVRTFAPILAGVAQMPYPRFMRFNVIGGLLWAVGITVAGYALGNVIGPEKVEKYLLAIVAAIMGVSALPVLFEVVRHRRSSGTHDRPADGPP